MRILLFVFFWMSLFLLTGCWDRVELNDVALIRGIGLDKNEDNRIEVTAEISIPTIQSGGSQGGGGSGGGGQTLIRTG
jgi:spore germination protein KC